MVLLQGGLSGIRRIVRGLASARAGKDDFGARSCAAFAISLVLFWLLGIVATTGPQEPGLLWPMLLVVFFLALISANFLGVLLALAGIGRAIWERRVPLYSVIGIVLNVAPSGFVLAILLFRA